MAMGKNNRVRQVHLDARKITPWGTIYTEKVNPDSEVGELSEDVMVPVTSGEILEGQSVLFSIPGAMPIPPYLLLLEQLLAAGVIKSFEFDGDNICIEY